MLGRILGFTSKVINPERLYETLTGKDNLFAMGYFDERTKNIIKSVDIPVGILIDKGLPEQCHRVLVPVYSVSDSSLLVYIQKFIHNSGLHVTLLDANDTIKATLEFKEAIRAIDYAAPNHVTVVPSLEVDNIDFAAFDLMLVSLSAWKQLVQEKQSWLGEAPSTLVLKP